MENLGPGRELDELIEETVMGRRDELLNAKDQGEYEKIRRAITYCPSYSTDTMAAMEILPKFDGFEIRAIPGESIAVTLYRRDPEEGVILNFNGRGETIAHAICVALLKSVGVE